MPLRPSSLARYIARSAALSRSSTLSSAAASPARRRRCRRPKSMCASIAKGSAIASITSMASPMASLTATQFAHSTPNSSPPSRAINRFERQPVAQPRRHRLQKQIADAVPQRVVDRLEAVEVDEKNRRLRRPALRRRQRLLAGFAKGHAIGQARQRVVIGQILRARVGLLATQHLQHQLLVGGGQVGGARRDALLEIAVERFQLRISFVEPHIGALALDSAPGRRASATAKSTGLAT